MKILKNIIFILPTIVFISVAIFHETSKGLIGSKYNPIKIYFTPAFDATKIMTNADDLVSYLERETDYYYLAAVPSSFIAIVEALGTKKADIAAISTFPYLLAHAKYGAQAKLRIVREGNITSYKGMFITRYDSEINTIEQIEGRSLAYVDPSSTSGYILPKALLEKKGIKPSETIFGMQHDNVVTMVYQGRVEVGAVYYAPPNHLGEINDARVRVKTQFPDIQKKIKIIGFTQEIPNDPWIFRKDLPENIKTKVIEALLKFVKLPEGKKTLIGINDIYGLITADDADYDSIRDILKVQNIQIEQVLKTK